MIRRGEYITLDGSAGEVIEGRVPTVEPEMPAYFKKFLSWADAVRKLGVRANADTPNDAKIARDFGAEGIGLCRTEHMFFDPERISAVREMIMAENAQQRGRALAKILPMQREDFVGILKAMAGLPVTIRLLDPPLHEFLPHADSEMRELAAKIGTTLRTFEAGAPEPVRGQSDAGASRLAAGYQLPRDLPGAGARDYRGGMRAA